MFILNNTLAKAINKRLFLKGFKNFSHNNIHYYELLKIPRNSTREEIKEAYYRLAKEYHPDSHKTKKHCSKDKFEESEHVEVQFYEITRAYEKLIQEKEKENNFSKDRSEIDELISQILNNTNRLNSKDRKNKNKNIPSNAEYVFYPYHNGIKLDNFDIYQIKKHLQIAEVKRRKRAKKKEMIEYQNSNVNINFRTKDNNFVNLSSPLNKTRGTGFKKSQNYQYLEDKYFKADEILNELYNKNTKNKIDANTEIVSKNSKFKSSVFSFLIKGLCVSGTFIILTASFGYFGSIIGACIAYITFT